MFGINTKTFEPIPMKIGGARRSQNAKHEVPIGYKNFNYSRMKKNILLNFLFWIIYCFIVAAFYSRYAGFIKSLSFSIITASFQAILIYINIFIWLPLFLKKKRILLYILSVLLTIFILTIIRFQILPVFGEEGRRVIGIRSRIAFFEINLLLAYSLGTAYYFIAEWFKNLQIRSEMKLRQVESELKYLKSQINPHFLFNTLNNIYTLCYLKDDKAAPSVLKLSEMMRYMLYESNTALIELEREVQFIRNYLELQQLKKDETMQIVFDVNGVKGRHKISPLILIAFFENCFKHGDIETNPQGWVKAELRVDEKNEMNFYIGNSKKQQVEKGDSRKSVGLENVKLRLSMLYENRHQLKIIEEDNLYKVHLTLTLDE